MKLWIISLILLAGSLKAQNLTMIKAMDQIDIYLHTVDVGKMVYDNFGHTAVRVHDKSTGQDLVYNWGIFDFGDPVSFSLRFYQGNLLYTLGVYPFEDAMRHYKYEKRTVWEDKLNFTPSQKLQLLKKLEWNYKPENRKYQYQYFFNNCSTKVRDYFDEVLQGTLKESFNPKIANWRFRDTIRKAYSTNPEIQFPLEIMMNSNIDRKISEWERMFLPIELRNSLLNFQNGSADFISDSTTIAEYKTPEPYKLNSFQMLLILMFTLVIGILILAKKLNNNLAERLLLTPCLFFLLYIGILGLLLPMNWFFSGHPDLYNNVNILLIWPTDICLFWLLTKVFWQGKRFALGNIEKSRWLIYINAHWLVFVIVTLLWLTGLISQDLSWIITYFMPTVILLLYLLQYKINNCEVKI